MVSKDAVLCRWSCVLFLFCGLGANAATPNFEVEAPTAAIAEKVALTADAAAKSWLSNGWVTRFPTGTSLVKSVSESAKLAPVVPRPSPSLAEKSLAGT